MIFVTVGTHEQQFDRLIKEIDNLVKEGFIQEKVIIQTGYSTYQPRYCEWSNFISYNDMIFNVNHARIVITHGGPASFMMPLQVSKTPIVVPRQLQYGEHVNDHQVEFALAVQERMGTIITVSDINNLKEVILNYDELVIKNNSEIASNNELFNNKIEMIVKEMF